MIFKTAHDLYNSTPFRKLRQNLMFERADSDGILRCEYCHKPIIHDYQCIAHHVKEVTSANLSNPEITLNPSNLQLVHLHCHNIIHNRFSYSIQKVYLIHGSPYSGKLTFVNESKMPGDLVCDMNLIWQMVTGGELNNKPNFLTSVVFNIRDFMYEQIKMRAGKWFAAYVTTTEPRQGSRERICRALGAEPIHIPCTREIALNRLKNDCKREDFEAEWEEYINNYFERYEEDKRYDERL